MCVTALEGQRSEASEPVVIGGCELLNMVLGMELRSSEGTASALSHLSSPCTPVCVVGSFAEDYV